MKLWKKIIAIFLCALMILPVCGTLVFYVINALQ